MINIVKIGLYALFLNYYPINIMFGKMIPMGTYAFFAMIVIGVLGDVMTKENGLLKIETEHHWWIWYLLISLITSMFAISTSYAVTSLVKFAMRVFIIIAVSYVCEEEKSIMFAIRLLAVVAVLSAATAFIQMEGIHGRLKLESGASISVNDFGSIMSYGCFAVIPFFGYSKIKNEFLKMALTLGTTLLMVVEMFIAGSRKSLYALLALYALLLLFVWLRNKNLKLSRILAFVLVGIAVIVVADKYLLPNLEETSLYQRIWGDKASSAATSDELRVDLYITAFNDFIENPIYGLGFNNYFLSHNSYTHSTYVEPLACSGIFAFVYLFPFFSILVKQCIKAIYEIKNKTDNKIEIELLIFYLMFLAIGIGIPYIYKDIPCIVLGMMVAHQYIEHDVVFSVTKKL